MISSSKTTTELLVDAAALNSEGVVTLVIDVGACVGTVVGFTDVDGFKVGTDVDTMVGFMDVVGASVGNSVAVKLLEPMQLLLAPPLTPPTLQ